MINPFKDVNWKPDTAEKRKFARSLMIGFPIIALVFLLAAKMQSGEWKTVPLWIGGIGFGAGAIFWLIPAIAKPFYLVWFGIACSIGIVISNVLLGAFYYLVITPIGLLMRICGKTPISKGSNRDAKTYWTDAERVVDSSRYFRQF